MTNFLHMPLHTAQWSNAAQDTYAARPRAGRAPLLRRARLCGAWLGVRCCARCAPNRHTPAGTHRERADSYLLKHLHRTDDEPNVELLQRRCLLCILEAADDEALLGGGDLQNSSFLGLTGLTSSWIRLCSLRFECLLKPLPQILHMRGASPVCILMCSLNFEGV